MMKLPHAVRLWRGVSLDKRNNDEEELQTSTYGQNKGTTSLLCPTKTI